VGKLEGNAINEQTRIGHQKELLLPTDVEGFDSLAELALDMRWIRNHAIDQVWRQLSSLLWELTHTAVAAGFDRFAPALVEQYLGGYAGQRLGLSRHDLPALGRRNPNDAAEPFNMAYLAIRGSGAVNGYAYRAEVSAARRAADSTARLMPWRDGVAIPLEEAHIPWQR
jgi:glucan phosphorylase